MVLSVNNSSADDIGLLDVGLYNEKEHEYFKGVIYLLKNIKKIIVYFKLFISHLRINQQ